MSARLSVPAETPEEAAERLPLESLPTIGVVGRYALKYRLGEGGLGTVHAALDPLLSRPIAVKTLHLQGTGAAQRTELEAMLLHEARAAAGLNHPHIVTVYDAGLSEQGVYITMERLQGRDLRQLLADGWRPEPLQAAQIVRRVADALAYAHSKGVIHCDVKPANIFMVGRTQPTVLDFGIARVARRGGMPEGALPPGSAAGSPYYMAPEQLRGDVVDARCDVYSLGVVLYELLTGQRAFEATSLQAIHEAVLGRVLPPAHQVNPAVPPALSEIAAKAMARDPQERFRSARHLARALRGVVEDPAPAAETAGARLPRKWALGAALTAVALVGTGAFLGRVPDHAPQAKPAALPAVEAAQPPTSAPVVVPEAVAASEEPAGAAGPEAAASATPEAPAVAKAPPAARAAALVVADAASRPARRARTARPADKPTATSTEAAPTPLVTGLINIAVSPWGQVEVDGVPAGTAPPLNQLTLNEGRHVIVVRNEDFPAYSVTVTVSADKPVNLRHRFGS